MNLDWSCLVAINRVNDNCWVFTTMTIIEQNDPSFAPIFNSADYTFETIFFSGTYLAYVQ
jgi:hypothetical protein